LGSRKDIYEAFKAGKLWRTLALLLAKPGALTQEYFAGKRTRYFTL